ncbi:protein O-mannosyl-transferase Tmtc2-like [Cloeon dipterum]|uniref:protein O-mannosyl-transferase Tmtc2-like n=1 Tax=Cloeon dipterum TaxID=197152 RepID=UPI003220359E
MWIVSGVCALAATLVFVNTFNAGFVYDDNRAILSNDDIRPSSPISNLFSNDFWGTPMAHGGSHKSFRPLTVLTFRLNYLAGGLDASGYHAANVLLHAVVSGLVPLWATLALRLPRRTALAAGLLFAVHPVHCEAVAGVVGRAELGATAAMLLALIALHKGSVRGALLLSTAGLLFKEQGLMTLPLCAAAVFLLRDRRDKRLLATLAAGFLAQLALRVAVMGGRLPHFSSADNPAAHSRDFPTRLMTFLHLPVINLKLFLLPTVLSFDWSMDAVPLVSRVGDARNVSSALLYAFLASLAAKCLNPKVGRVRGRAVVMSLALVALTYVPVSNAVGYVGFVVAERTLYAPSIGLCLLTAIGASELWRRAGRTRWPLAVLAACLLLSLAARTWIRNSDWRDEEALYRAGIPVNPPKAYGNLGSVLSARGRLAEAEHCYRQALRHRPNMADVHYNLGLLLMSQQRLEEAITSFRNSISFRPRLAAAHVSLGVALGQAKRHAEARQAFLRATNLDGRGLKDPKSHESARISALFHLGRHFLEQDQPQHALTYLLRAKEQMPQHFHPQSIYNLIGETYGRLGQHVEAEPWLQASLASKPDHIPAHLNYGKILATNKSRAHEAESWYRRALHLAPHDANVLRQYGQFLMQQERHAEAAVFLEGVVNSSLVHRGQSQYPDLVNLATCMRIAGRLEQAEHYYLLAREADPNNPASHINLGAILHLQAKLAPAERCYLRALELSPDDEIANLNLRRLRNLTEKSVKVAD